MHFKFLSYILICVILLFGCKEKKSYPDVEIIAHAVSGLYNPSAFFSENSVEAVEYALEFESLNGIEIDVQYSADGTLWMFHDESLEENTNGSGKVCMTEDSELNEISYSAVDKSKLARLSDVNWNQYNFNKNIYLDFKNFNLRCFDTILSSKILHDIESINFSNNYEVFINLDDTLYLNEIATTDYKIILDAYSFDDASNKLSLVCDGVFIRNSELTEEEVNVLMNFDKKLILFDVFSLTSLKKALKKHPSALMVEDFKTAIIEKN